MDFDWTTGPAAPSRLNPYEAWSLEHATAPAVPGARFFPVYGDLKPTNGSYGETATAILSMAADSEGWLALDGHEADWMTALGLGVDAFDAPQALLPCVVYVRADHLESDALAALIDIVHIGPFIDLGPDLRTPYPASAIPPIAPQEPGEIQNTAPVIAVIDDCVPYLNTRLRKGDQSRFAGAWIQAPDSEAGDGSAASRIAVGRTLSGTEITSLIAEARLSDETHIYGRLNRQLFAPPRRRPSDAAAAHGAAVFDLAAGADPGDPMQDTALLGVQLPPYAVRDTSGRRFLSYVIQGLRWIVTQAHVLRAAREAELGNGARAGLSLVVNLSIGAHAGPKNGTGILDRAIIAETARFRALLPGSEMRVVLAYGNAQRMRQTGLVDLSPGATTQQELDLRILPDDRTDSFVEIRATTGANVKLTLTPPMGPTQEIRLGDGQTHTLLRDSVAVARLSPAPADRPRMDCLLLALRPSTDPTGRSVAPAGTWGLAFQSDAPATVTLQVQRDDTPDPFLPSGRQAYLDHPDAYDYDRETRDFTAPNGGPILREGDHAPHGAAETAAVADPLRLGIYTVGAARRVPAEGKTIPSRYSAAGTSRAVLSQSSSPTLSALADESAILPGVRTAGVRSGSTMRLSGTSAAAPKVARALAQEPALDTFSSPSDKNAEVASLLGFASLDPPDPRKGRGVLDG